MARATFASRSVRNPTSSSRRTPSSGSPRRASAGRTCGPTAASAARRPDADGTRVLRHRRRRRQRSHVGQAGAVRDRLVCRVRQHVPPLPGRIPNVVPASASGSCGAQAPMLRVPLADGTLVATPDVPSADLVPSLLAVSDVLGTGWFAADAANVKPGTTVVVVGDGAVGLLGVLSAKQMGAERIIAMSRHDAAAEARARVRRDRHRDRARRRRRRAHQGADQRRRRGLRARMRRARRNR